MTGVRWLCEELSQSPPEVVPQCTNALQNSAVQRIYIELAKERLEYVLALHSNDLRYDLVEGMAADILQKNDKIAAMKLLGSICGLVSEELNSNRALGRAMSK